jgi:hypothetical protein
VGPDYRSFSVDIKPLEEKGRFFVDVAINPLGKTNLIKPRKERLAMSDLKPVSLELVKNEQKKRVYKLNLTPSIKRIDHTRRKIDADTLHLERWHFDRSKVIVDNWRYAGTLTASGMSLAFVDICGYARIEFGLQPFRDAQLLGSLRDGTLTIQKPGGLNRQTVVIDNVKMGTPAMTIPGGPYAVWVRWSPLSKTIIQAAQKMIEMQVRAQQQTLKEIIGKMKEADFATNGIILQMLSEYGLLEAGGAKR